MGKWDPKLYAEEQDQNLFNLKLLALLVVFPSITFEKRILKQIALGTFLAVQGLGAFTAVAPGFSPSGGTKIMRAVPHGKKKLL